MVHGHHLVGGGPRGRLPCADCEELAPHPGTAEFDVWVAPLRWFLVTRDITCADADNEKVAHTLARVKFAAFTRSQTYYAIPPIHVPLWRTVKAYAVDRIEPGRVRELMAASDGSNVRPLGLSHPRVSHPEEGR